MRLFFIFVLTIFELFSLDIEQVTIDNKAFTIVKEDYSEYGSKGRAMRFYKGVEQNESAMLFSLVLEDATGSCSAREIQEGSYEINGSTITLYSLWKRSGKAYDVPSGVRVKVYKVLSDGSLDKNSSRVYIEESQRKHSEGSGMEYLFFAPKTPEEKEALDEYIEEVEDKYDGVFVRGDEKKALYKEVKEALKRKMKAQWRKR